ncbi:MAG: hypothetical protein ACR2G3_04805 [Solirubrobacterales bacterium]
MTENSNQKRSHGITGIHVRFAALLLVAVLSFPTFAAAQSPTDDQYDDIPPSVSVESGGGSVDPGGLGGDVGPLPFTGFDVIAMLAVALAVTGVGLALQRAVARESTDQI